MQKLHVRLLAPVILILVLLLIAILSVVNDRFSSLYQSQTRQALNTAQAVFENAYLFKMQMYALLAEKSAADPRLRSVSTLEDKATMQNLLVDIRNETNADAVIFFNEAKARLAHAGHALEIDPEDIFTVAKNTGKPWDLILPVSGTLCQVSIVPVSVGGGITGWIAFFYSFDDQTLKDLAELTDAEIILRAGDTLLGDTLTAGGQWGAPPLGLRLSLPDSTNKQQTLLLDDVHYMTVRKPFSGVPGPDHAEYILLRSYESAIRDLHSIQRILILVAGAGLLGSISTIWFVVRRVTTPLRELHDGAEAVGSGDFTGRLQIKSTGEVGDLVSVFNLMTENLATSRNQLEKTNQELISASRRAGMTEIATSVLHNVGNVLNSLNISTELLHKNVHESGVSYLRRVVKLLDANRDDLGRFLTEDPKGQRVPDFLHELSERLDSERDALLKELNDLKRNTQHIKEIVALQQKHAKGNVVEEVVSLAELVEDAIRLQTGSWERHRIRVLKHYDAVPPFPLQRHQILQIVVNLFKNATYAIKHSTNRDRRLTLGIHREGNDMVAFSVRDMGTGISEESMKKLFQYGFTTKEEGHGFGLHSCANSARDMGGELRAHSDGLNCGATFTLLLPIAGTSVKPSPPHEASTS